MFFIHMNTYVSLNNYITSYKMKIKYKNGTHKNVIQIKNLIVYLGNNGIYREKRK